MNHFLEDILLGPAKWRLREFANGSQKALSAIPPAVSKESTLNVTLLGNVSSFFLVTLILSYFNLTRNFIGTTKNDVKSLTSNRESRNIDFSLNTCYGISRKRKTYISHFIWCDNQIKNDLWNSENVHFISKRLVFYSALYFIFKDKKNLKILRQHHSSKSLLSGIRKIITLDIIDWPLLIRDISEGGLLIYHVRPCIIPLCIPAE